MVAKKNIDIIPYAEEYREGLLKLQKRFYSSSAIPIDRYLRWKYDLNPNAANGIILLAVSGGRVVGARGFKPAAWKTTLPGCEFMPLAGDTVVHQEFEGIGLVKRMTEAARQYFAERGVAVMLNTSASPAVYYLSLRSGWKPIGEYQKLAHIVAQPLWFLGVRSIAAKTPLLWRLVEPRFLPDFKRMSTRSLRRNVTKDKQYFSISSELAPASAAFLAETHRPIDKLAMVRDESFFAWRFKNPYHRYLFLTCHENDRLVGYFALRQRLNSHPDNVSVVDWCCPHRSIFRGLLETLLQFRGKLIEFSALSLSTDEMSELRNHGFTDINHGMPEGPEKKWKYKPSVLAMSTGIYRESFDKLVAEGAELMEFKGIESDCA